MDRIQSSTLEPSFQDLLDRFGCPRHLDPGDVAVALASFMVSIARTSSVPSTQFAAAQIRRAAVTAIETGGLGELRMALAVDWCACLDHEVFTVLHHAAVKAGKVPPGRDADPGPVAWERPALPSEVCSCGAPARIVFVAAEGPDAPYCLVPDVHARRLAAQA